MKREERAEARRLRTELPWSVGRIAAHLGVAKSSTSRWVAGVPLTPTQEQALRDADPARNGRGTGTAAHAARCRERRLLAQAAGRRRARAAEPLHPMGCMLHWAEGSKERNRVVLVNSDPALLQLFLRFLRDCLDVADERIALTVNLHLGNGLTADEIQQYWLDRLRLPPSCLRTPVVTPPSDDALKRGKLPYGTARVVVSSTELVQHVYGAIQEYGGFDRPEWLA